MSVILPSGINNSTGYEETLRPSLDQIQADLNGATVNGQVTRRGGGIFVSGGDSIFFQKTFTDFAAASTTADSTLMTIPGNSYIFIAASYVEVVGDNVATLSFEILDPVSGTVYLTGIDGLTLNTNLWTINVITAGAYVAGPFGLVARAVSTGGNLNTMTQGAFDFAVTYFTLK